MPCVLLAHQGFTEKLVPFFICLMMNGRFFLYGSCETGAKHRRGRGEGGGSRWGALWRLRKARRGRRIVLIFISGGRCLL